MNFIRHYILFHSILKYADRFEPVENKQGIINLVINKRIKSEIIGHWLYCFTTELIGVQLLSIGFWYSFKHRAYVYSGSNKEGIADDETLDEIRSRLGSRQIVEIYP
jgi:hypothetical protein